MVDTTLAFNILTKYRDAGARKAAADMDHLEKSTSHMGDRMKKVAAVGAIGLAGGLALGAKAMVGMTKSAIEDEASQKRLQRQLQNSAGATKAQVAQTEAWISKQGVAKGVTDDELRPALGKLVGATHDVGKAQKLASLAMDISAGTGKSLSTVTQALMKAQNGQVAGLSKLGIKTQDSVKDQAALQHASIAVTEAHKKYSDALKQSGPNSAAAKLAASKLEYAQTKLGEAQGKVKKTTIDFAEAQKRLADTFGGQAATKANTFQGKMDRLKLIFHETQETIGGYLLPILNRLGTWLLNKGVPAVQQFVADFKAGRGEAGRFASILHTVGTTVAAVAGFLNRHRAIIATVIAGYVAWKLAVVAFRVQEAVSLAVLKAHTVGTIQHTVVSKAAAVGTKVWAAGQWLLNAALTANPIGLVIVAIAALVAGVIIAYKKSETFRKIVHAAFHAVGDAATWMWNTAIKPALKFVQDAFVKTMDFAKTLRSTFVRVMGDIKSTVRTATVFIVDKFLTMAQMVINGAAKAFGWVPGLGGKLRSAAKHFASFRDDVNTALAGVKDQHVTIGIQTIRSASAKNDKMLGHNVGGAGRSLPAAAFGGGMGGASRVVRDSGGPGLHVDTDTPIGPVKKIAQQIAREVQASAAASRKDALADAVKSYAAGMPHGKMGPAGQVLPRGSYSIGMPYLGYPGHYGADYPARTGTPVFSPWPGHVTASYDIPGQSAYNNLGYASYGRVVKIAHPNGLATLYAHLYRRMVGAGANVRAGQQIGQVGQMGNATGPHLHFEVSRGGHTFNPASLHLFDRGGWLLPSMGARNQTGKPEAVLTPPESAAFVEIAHRLTNGRGGGADDTLQRLEQQIGQLNAELNRLSRSIDKRAQEFHIHGITNPSHVAREVARQERHAGAR